MMRGIVSSATIEIETVYASRYVYVKSTAVEAI